MSVVPKNFRKIGSASYTAKSATEAQIRESGTISESYYKAKVYRLTPGQPIISKMTLRNCISIIVLACSVWFTSQRALAHDSHVAVPIVSGAKNIAFILFNMPGGTNPVTNSDVVRTMETGWFGAGSQTVAKIFEANSFGAVTVGGYQTFGPISLSVGISGTCNSSFYTSLDAAISSALSSIDLSSFDYLVFVLPTEMGSFCGWSGITWGPNAAALSGDVNPVVTSHEIGHLFGMNHSAYDRNNDGVINPADGDLEYGDPSCIMGGYGRFYSLAHKERQEWWLAAGGNLVTASDNGVATTALSPYQNSPISVSYAAQAIQKNLADGSKYIVTFGKNPTPSDPSFDLRAAVNNHVFITRVYPGDARTYLVAVLGEGQSFSDTIRGVTFHFVSQSVNTASVKLSHGDLDSDNDGQLNSIDNDDDNDGVSDATDCAPLSALHWRTVDGACIGANQPSGYPALRLSTSSRVKTNKSSFKILGSLTGGTTSRAAAGSVKAPNRTMFTALKGVTFTSRSSASDRWAYTVKTPTRGVYQVKIYPCNGTTCSTVAKTVKITRR